MKNVISLALFTNLFLFVHAQNSPVYISFEGGGTGLIASANIGKNMFIHRRYKVMVQTGLGWTPAIAKPESPFNVPLQLSFNFGQSIWFFETGVGFTFIPKSRLHKSFDAEAAAEFYTSPIVGFRHESNNWFGRAYICPLYHLSGDHIYDEVTKDFIKIGIGIGAIL